MDMDLLHMLLCLLFFEAGKERLKEKDYFCDSMDMIG